jgi:NADH-quinone oxidoreductase subunit G
MATIEIDGLTCEAENGKMIIEVADEVGIPIPRFCYHKKLSVAANCRMCLVEVENGRKPVPACATPITNGMKVFTKSKEAIRSQQAVMEFLLINHPLDCPICDQGGECELQDVSLGFGNYESHYEETKRAVKDDDLGSLVETEMTRCIHCTRCVRFGDEIAGLREMGATGRGEDMQIGTYVQHSLRSEISANIIDLCPVGALTSKPYRFTARAWELNQYEGVAPHDCLGSNVYLHVRRNELMRVIPKENENINETWLSDRDRFSYLGLNSKHRALHPRIKRNGQWETVDWETALTFAADGIAKVIKHHGSEQFAAFASPSSTTEEMYLLQKMMRELGVENLDHRLQQTDNRDDLTNTAAPTNTLTYKDIEKQKVVVLIGCNIEREVPLAAVRVRKAFRNGAHIYAINPMDYDYRCPVTDKILVSPLELPMQLAKLVLALSDDVANLPKPMQKLLLGLKVDKSTKNIAKALKEENAVLLTGALCDNHPEAALIRTFIHTITQLSNAKSIRFTTGANAMGAWLSGMVPHRTPAGKIHSNPGLSTNQALDAKLKGYFLLEVEPAMDCANPSSARQAMLGAEFVVALSAFEQESLQDYVNVILPIAPYSETSGTYVNVDAIWQTVKGVVAPQGEARPAWKILRVLANLLQLPGFDYESSEAVLEEVKTECALAPKQHYQPFYPEELPVQKHALVRLGEWPLYRQDAIVRHATALQNCAAAESACIRIHPITANRLKLNELATVSQGDIEITLPLKRDDRMVVDVVWVANALPETIDLGHSFSEITIKMA